MHVLVLSLLAVHASAQRTCRDTEENVLLQLHGHESVGRSPCPCPTSVEELNTSIEGTVEVVPPKWNFEDDGWTASIADTYYWHQPPGLFESNRPSYTVTVKNVADIQEALCFARETNMKVSVKGNGHSYFGGSYGGQLLIYMGDMTSTNVQESRTYCNSQHNSIEVGGGTTFFDMYSVILDNYSVVGGACPSVGAGGGWAMGNGLANELLPMYGLGIDQILQYDIVLADGRHVQANECSHPKLFKALRGGGGGFGVVTSIHYKLHPPKPLQEYEWTPCNENSSDPSNPNTTKRWDLLIRWAGKWDRRWSTKYISCAAIYTFVGTHAEAQTSEFYKDATSTFGPPIHKSYRSVLHFKLTDGGSGWEGWKDLPTSMRTFQDDTFEGNWHIPLEYLINKPLEARDTFINMGATPNGLCAINGEYLLLGKNNEIEESTDPTSVNPATRRAAFQFTVCNKSVWDTLQNMFPDSCQGINHAGYKLSFQDFQDQVFGPRYPELLSVKETVDRHRLFQCTNCVGSEL